MSLSPPDDDPPPVEPVAPGDNECCGSGCDPCVFDRYNEARQRYFVALRAWQERKAQREGLPSPSGAQPPEA